MDIQILEHKDIGFITDLQPPDWQDIIPTIDFYLNANFCFPIKVTVDHKIVGIGTAIVHNRTAWLAHIIVHPENRNQGIGSLLTETLVKSLQSKSCDTIYLIATELGEPVYKKVGFETETEYLFFKETKTSKSYATSDSIVPFSDDFKILISNLDQEISGEERMVQLEQHLSKGSVYIEKNAVEGFYLPTLGDGFIAARTNSAGQELMKLRLITKENAAFPVDNAGATEFMYKNNFKEFKRAKRMRLGKKRNWQPANIYNRIGGNLG
ncbi:MAG TPA: N-acetyltransferase [Bacteroidetes bacterium]|nr:N-acetyltransferase [Bacteroidota bacterium]